MQNSLVTNKFYTYANSIVKLKKISKKINKIHVEEIKNGNILEIPYIGYEILLHRIYTVGEVAKIVEKRPDTIRKYEKRSLIPEAKKFGKIYGGYAEWRYYTQEDVYLMVEFFNSRVPGRPVEKSNININKLTTKVDRKVRENV